MDKVVLVSKIRMQLRKWFTGLFTLSVFLSFSQMVFSQTNLTGLINYSLKNSHEIKKADLDIEQSGYARWEAIGQGLPQVEGKGSYSKMFLSIDMPSYVYDLVGTNYKSFVDQIAGIDALYTASLGVQVTQLLYSQSYIQGLKTTKKAQELYSVLKSKTEEEIIADIASNYYQTLSLYLQLQTIDKSLINLKEIYRIVELNYKNDFVKESQVSRLKVSITNLEVNKQTIQNGIELQVNYLKTLAGMPEDTTLTIDTTDLIQKLVINNSTFSGFSADNVPAFQTLQKQDELYKQQIKISQAEYFPTLAAYGQLNYTSYNTKADIDKMYNMSTIGVQLKVPLFKSGVQHAKVQQKRIEELKIQEDIKKTRELLNVGYNNAVTEYQSACSLLAAQKDNRDLALKVYNQTSLQYKEGMASMADLLNVNSDFIQADNSFNQQVIKCKISEVKVLKASGSLKQLSDSK
jgi:outer membrane protein